MYKLGLFFFGFYQFFFLILTISCSDMPYRSAPVVNNMDELKD